MHQPGMTRRALLQTGLGLALGTALAGCSSGAGSDAALSDTGGTGAPAASPTPSGWAMPAEWLEHERTFMAWPALTEVWGDQLTAVRADIAGLAQAIARYEPVVLMARADQADQAQQQVGNDVEVLALEVDDLWARDTGPTFVTGPGGLAGVELNFNGWGDKQTHANDAHVAANLLAHYGVRRIQAPITGEGGAIETDGDGTLMATESSLVNDNRNPGRSRDEIEADLKTLFGVEKVIWFKGVAGQDITDCHVDALARFVGPGVVALQRPGPNTPPDIWSTASDQALTVLNAATDAHGRPLRVVPITDPDLDLIQGTGKDFLATYLNFYVCNGAVIVPRFGDQQADDKAAATLRDLHPGRDVVQVSINAIASGGGGIHCSTQQQPKLGATTPTPEAS
ncbi:agmatine deiminase family protein [Streptacidiphilus jiangxiensis]|uniref:Agmatine deiminase n=1 Tax=Streptacidiphilus jiangxiensis TaxID=235985 RepID=A0A1H7WTE2_STRJI|nr:agmatine deiminase family protein [Streptacidiphilus jiangxiensis]SEM24840.1 agmatine deiminase [Streptacidiphilus jiangxiensis]